MWRKWKERDSAKLRELERKFSDDREDWYTHRRYIDRQVRLMQEEINVLTEKLSEKEVIHTQKVEVTVKQPSASSWDDFPY